ncbi:MAG: MoxR family ATPase, partial [Planctomycetaceae bacterium]|nr:MoxR family ATPase [Planctomycetaceae bacterium]
LGCQFGRIQFTADLMPSDITGAPVFDVKDSTFRFRPGPVFTQLLLADEINRSPAKTHAALLEIMQEYRVTIDGTSHTVPRPFLVLATQNPLESEGTYNLPEAQLDRFMFKLLIDYPPSTEEVNILRMYASGKDNRRPEQFDVSPILTADEIIKIQNALTRIIVEESILEYIHKIINSTRNWPSIEVGASPRAGVNLLLAARAMAACRGRDFVIPDDVKALAPWVLRHRLRLNPDAEIEGTEPDQVIQDILDNVEAPRT